MQAPIFTTSWDDGYPADLRLGDLLARHGIAATFYVPTHNREGRAVLRPTDIVSLGSGFEIGGHTSDHMALPGQPRDVALDKITQNKAWLEEILGRPVPGFCYPRGKFDCSTKELVRKAGYAYARTVQAFQDEPTRDPYEMATTLQFYPHPRDVYLRNFVRSSPSKRRMSVFLAAMREGSLRARIFRLIDEIAARAGIVHFWGHSWEIEALGLWDDLEAVLKHAGQVFGTGQRLTNGETRRFGAIS